MRNVNPRAPGRCEGECDNFPPLVRALAMRRNPCRRVRPCLQIPELPQVPQFRAWLLALRYEVATASGSPEDGFRWILEVDRKSYHELSNNGSSLQP